MRNQTPLGSGFGRHTPAADVVAGVDLSGKTMIVTGGHSGIGIETVRALAGAGASVICASRDVARAGAALEGMAGDVTVMAMDLASLDSIHDFADAVLERHDTIDVLINNAGIMACPLERVGRNWESQFGVCHLGHFALTDALMPALLAADAPRVVALSSTAHIRGGILWDDIHFKKTEYNKWDAYAQAKSANALFALGLDMKFAHEGLRAFSVHPGGIFTPLQRHLSDEEMVALGWKNADGTVPPAVAALFKTPGSRCGDQRVGCHQPDARRARRALLRGLRRGTGSHCRQPALGTRPPLDLRRSRRQPPVGDQRRHGGVSHNQQREPIHDCPRHAPRFLAQRRRAEHLCRCSSRLLRKGSPAGRDGQMARSRCVPRAFWEKAGEAGLLCASMPEEYGGAGGDFRHESVLMEVQGRMGVDGFGGSLHNAIVAPYILHYGSEEQKKKWLPRMATGELIGAIAMTEPGAGSDLQGIKTTALKSGNQYVINGSKTFITNGQNANLIIVVAKTDPAAGARGTSLLVVEADDAEGFRRGRNLDKIGMDAQDTSELFFDDVKVPTANLLGAAEGMGFFQLMEQLASERLQIGIQGCANMHRAITETIAYVKDRKAFGKSVMDFQNTQFKLAECKTKLTIAQAFTDHCTDLLLQASSIPAPPRWRNTGCRTWKTKSWTSACSCTAAGAI
jgi:acyl-CoA dehydrogenase